MSVAENATRGGIVLTDPSVAPTVVLTGGPVTCDDECFPASNSTYDDWVAMDKPDCWCSPFQCDGDADGVASVPLKYRIYSGDLAMVVDNWKRKINDPLLDPCADIDHKGSVPLKYRVYSNDLSTVVNNWKKKDSQLPGDCPRPE
jgi:hypothetical protein